MGKFTLDRQSILKEESKSILEVQKRELKDDYTGQLESTERKTSYSK